MDEKLLHPMERWIEEIRERREKATPGPWLAFHDDYDAGTSLISSDPKNSDATVIADSTAELNANFLAHSWTDIGRLLDERERVRTMLDPNSLFNGLEDAAAHRMQAYITEQSNVQDLEREVERLRAENAEVWEQAVKIAENPNNISMVGGSTGDAYGTSKLIAAALRARQANEVSHSADSNRCKHNVDLSAICEMCDYETADEGE